MLLVDEAVLDGKYLHCVCGRSGDWHAAVGVAKGSYMVYS
jgi:hypothetical protein